MSEAHQSLVRVWVGHTCCASLRRRLHDCRKSACEEPFADGSSVRVCHLSEPSRSRYTHWLNTVQSLMHSTNKYTLLAQRLVLYLWRWHGQWWYGRDWRIVWTPQPNIKRSLVPLTVSAPGVPPWNNKGCNFTSMVDQLNTVNPMPKAGGKDTWHPPSKQVRYTPLLVT